MNQNKLTIILVVFFALAVIAIGGLAIALKQSFKERELDNRSLRQANKELKLYQDSLKRADVRLRNRETYWFSVLSNERAAWLEESKKTTHKTIVYEKAYTTPPPAWSAPELDSIGDAILARRQHRH